ncbi:MAG: hypothetical protein V4515_14345 [Chloroflexota bacterium]
MIRRILLVAAMVLAGIGVAGPARADDPNEIQYGCDHTAPSIGSAGYTEYFGGSPIDVRITVGWQYVGGASSACEDININSAVEDNIFWTYGVFKVRTYMCNSGGSCWYNAWRNCQGGCQAATDMGNGTKYQVHFATQQYIGAWIHEYD